MKYNIIGRNIEVTKGLENAVEDKLHKLNKYFNDQTEVQVMLSVEKFRHIIEITIPFNGRILRGEVEGKDMYAIIDDAVALIERQVVRFKNKLRHKQRNKGAVAVAGFTDSFVKADTQSGETLKIERKKKFFIKPMDEEEAIMQMELLGHNFFVYRDAYTEEVNVVYRRNNGTYGLIESSID